MSSSHVAVANSGSELACCAAGSSRLAVLRGPTALDISLDISLHEQQHAKRPGHSAPPRQRRGVFRLFSKASRAQQHAGAAVGAQRFSAGAAQASAPQRLRALRQARPRDDSESEKPGEEDNQHASALSQDSGSVSSTPDALIYTTCLVALCMVLAGGSLYREPVCLSACCRVVLIALDTAIVVVLH